MLLLTITSMPAAKPCATTIASGCVVISSTLLSNGKHGSVNSMRMLPNSVWAGASSWASSNGDRGARTISAHAMRCTWAPRAPAGGSKVGLAVNSNITCGSTAVRTPASSHHSVIRRRCVGRASMLVSKAMPRPLGMSKMHARQCADSQESSRRLRSACGSTACRALAASRRRPVAARCRCHALAGGGSSPRGTARWSISWHGTVFLYFKASKP